MIRCCCSAVAVNFYNLLKFSTDPPRWLSVRAFAWGTESCGIDPQPRHDKNRKKMVQVAPLLTLGIES